MQSIKALQFFRDVVIHGVIEDTTFRNIRLYNIQNIYVDDDIKLDDEFYQCKFKLHEETIDFNKIDIKNINFRIFHKIIKYIKKVQFYSSDNNDKNFNIYHYYIGNIFYITEKPSIYGTDLSGVVYGTDLRGAVLYNQIAVKTVLNDLRTRETILEIIALKENDIMLSLDTTHDN